MEIFMLIIFMFILILNIILCINILIKYSMIKNIIYKKLQLLRFYKRLNGGGWYGKFIIFIYSSYIEPLYNLFSIIY